MSTKHAENIINFIVDNGIVIEDNADCFTDFRIPLDKVNDFRQLMKPAELSSLAGDGHNALLFTADQFIQRHQPELWDYLKLYIELQP